MAGSSKEPPHAEPGPPGSVGGFDHSSPLPAGKLPPELLRELLAGLSAPGKRLLTGPGVGEDAAVISFGATSLVAKADPITFATDLIGWYAVHVNANDIAATGATPKWFMPTVLLPEGTTVAIVESIFKQLREAAGSTGVELIGGHTEITGAVPQPVISGAMLGEAPASGTVSTSGAKPGDSIILTKGIAVEGTSLLAREFRQQALAVGITPETLEKAADFLFEPGISVLKDAQTAAASGPVTAMHDPTEGGLASALAELSEASGNGLTVNQEAVPVFPECQQLCDALGVDPWGLISSGALLITCAPDSVDSILKGLQATEIHAVEIGRMTGHGDPALLSKPGGNTVPLPVFARDEIARLFSSNG